MRLFHGIAELEAAVGTHIGYSDWRTITQDQIDAFAHATGDHQWIHMDRERSVYGPFGSTIAHGFLTLSLVPMMVWEVYRIQGAQMGLNYGADKLRFPAPVPVESNIRAGVDVLSIAPSRGGHQVRLRVTVERDGGDKPVCVVDTVSIVFA